MKSKENWKRCKCVDSCFQCRVTWTLLLLLWVHHNKAAGMNEDQAAHFFFSGSTEWGLHATVVPPLPSLGFIHPSPSSPGWWRAGTPAAFIWAEAVAPINTRGAAQCGEPPQPHNTWLITPYSTIPQEREMGRKGNAGSFPSMGATQGSNYPWVTSPRAPALLHSNDKTLNPRKETEPSPFSFSWIGKCADSSPSGTQPFMTS